jgi:hypothetical protein
MPKGNGDSNSYTQRLNRIIGGQCRKRRKAPRYAGLQMADLRLQMGAAGSEAVRRG